ncbi:MAG TPA: HAMP domain-containing protein, partial [Thermoanaerobaculia bacterium]|nr:HAMP domain-containing protein [Thermoanaerobaculia bacterium]
MSTEVPTPESEGQAARRGRLLWTLLGAMVIVGLVPLVVSHYFLIDINRDALETLERQYLSRAAVSIAADTNNLLTSNRQQLSKIAGSILIMKKALPAGTDPFTYAAETEWIGDYMTADSDIIALRVVNGLGQGGEAKQAQLEREIMRDIENARLVAMTGKESTGEIKHIAALNVPAVVLAVPVVENEQVIGAIVGLVSLRRIVDRVREEGKGDVAAFLVGKDGRVLIHSEPSIDVQHPDFSRLKIVQDFQRGPVRVTEPYVDSFGGRSVKVLGTVAPVSTQVGVVVQKPEKTAYASVDQMIRATLLWFAIALALAIAAAIVFASGIARPIRMLADRTREIANGNYQQRVEFKSHNEIGELAQNFNVM